MRTGGVLGSPEGSLAFWDEVPSIGNNVVRMILLPCENNMSRLRICMKVELCV